MSEQNADGVSVHIPRALYERVQERARGAGFATAEAYIHFVLDEVTLNDDDGSGGAGAQMSAQEEGELVDRLRGLGYIE